MAENERDLQEILDVIGKFSTDTGTKLSAEKSQILIINESNINREERKWKLLNQEMKKVNEYKYLGLTIGNKGLEKEKNNIRVKAEKNLSMIKAKTKLRANKYEITRGLWKGIAVPTLLYGAEILEIGGKETKGLEVVQNKAAREGLGAEKYTPIETLRGEMGWSTFEERIQKSKIKYRIRLEYMNENRWPKKIFNWIGKKGKFIREGNRRMKKINMKIEQKQEGKEIWIEGNEINTTENILKKKINTLVQKKGIQVWKQGIDKKKSLRWYKEKEKPRKENFYNGDWEAKLLFKARSNTLEVNSRIHKWKDIDKHCEKCSKKGIEIEETLEHVLVECDQYKNERENFEEKIVGKIGEEKWSNIKEKEEEITVILGFDSENILGVEDTKKFLGEIWNKRKEKEILEPIRLNEHNYHKENTT